MNRNRAWLGMLIGVWGVVQAVAAEPLWPQFRGPNAAGIADGQGLPDRWSATENVAWKQDLPGRGWSSPIVWGSRVFVTTAVDLGESETPRKGLYLGGNRLAPPTSEHEWRVLCLDLDDGHVVWERTVHRGVPQSAIHLKNSFASETPVTDGERVYAYFGNVGLFVFDLEGTPVWSQRFDPQPTRDGWGTAASPVLHQDRIYLVNDNEQQSYLLALDKRTGQTAWRIDRDEKSNWATPLVWQSAQRTELVTNGTGKVRSYDLNGQLLWWLQGMSDITIPTPQAGDDLLYLASGFVFSARRPVYAIRPGATGDISLTGDATSNAHIAWCQPRGGSYNPSTLLYQQRLYVLLDLGLLSCYDASDGMAKYERQRIPRGRAFTASPWAADGNVFCVNEDGVTFVFRAGDDFQLLHTNALAEDDMCLATPAAAGNRLLLRTSARIYCLARP